VKAHVKSQDIILKYTIKHLNIYLSYSNVSGGKAEPKHKLSKRIHVSVLNIPRKYTGDFNIWHIHQQKGGLHQIHSCRVLTLLDWTLRPVRPVRPVPMRHIWLRLVRLETLAYTGFRLDTCNKATLPPMHPDLVLNTIAHQDSPLPLILLSAFFVYKPRCEQGVFLGKENIVSARAW